MDVQKLLNQNPQNFYTNITIKIDSIDNKSKSLKTTDSLVLEKEKPKKITDENEVVKRIKKNKGLTKEKYKCMYNQVNNIIDKKNEIKTVLKKNGHKFKNEVAMYDIVLDILNEKFK